MNEIDMVSKDIEINWKYIFSDVDTVDVIYTEKLGNAKNQQL
jgi:hypothetical protein